MTARAQPMKRPASLPSGCRVEVELGCADADFSYSLAQQRPDIFVVGLEIREAVVERNRRQAKAIGVENIAFGYVNMNVDLDRVFAPDSIDCFHLLFPDPWFKPRHRKRRVVDIELCRSIERLLRPGGEFHIATDIYDLGLEAMAELEDAHGSGLSFVNVLGPWRFARENPSVAESRREFMTRRRGDRVWRMRYSI